MFHTGVCNDYSDGDDEMCLLVFLAVCPDVSVLSVLDHVNLLEP